MVRHVVVPVLIFKRLSCVDYTDELVATTSLPLDYLHLERMRKPKLPLEK